ncbi:hypothetical protein NDU88_006090 [Pleurodeles waltl]|uniref:Uncharacterized protein n=1 Tax=Pleurodeles waltl TaxID=8319 RepID=A0AAV7WWK5_PLEWA|nr:hypothetical protein NDU88_006090 [Pleurodeles waltl]
MDPDVVSRLILVCPALVALFLTVPFVWFTLSGSCCRASSVRTVLWSLMLAVEPGGTRFARGTARLREGRLEEAVRRRLDIVLSCFNKLT